MNLNQLLLDKKINNLGYDTLFLEKPVSTLIDFDYKQILSAPPKNDDTATIKELKLVAQATKNRSKKDIELIYNIDKDLDDIGVYFFNPLVVNDTFQFFLTAS